VTPASDQTTNTAEMDQKELEQVAGGDDMAMDNNSPTDDRRMSREWGKLRTENRRKLS
jgi:hypothetical protein